MTLFAQHVATFVYLLPLVAVISLVYGATRYENWTYILIRSARLSIVVLLFMAVILAVITGIQLRPQITTTIVVTLMVGSYIWQKRAARKAKAAKDARADSDR